MKNFFGLFFLISLIASIVIFVPDAGQAYNDIKQLKQLFESLNKDAKYAKDRSAHMKRWEHDQDVDVGVRDLGAPGFSCTNGKSESVPTSVNALRPGDIKVIGALGDSLTAANGAGANKFIEVLLEYRGLSFLMGGDGDVSDMITLPNILQTFNPQLIGAAQGVGPVWLKSVSHLDVAIPGSIGADMPDQAVELVKRIKSDQRIDLANDWKLVSIFVGSNDLCSYCQHRFSQRPGKFRRELEKAIDYLKKNLPRTLVNIVNVAHPDELVKTHRERFWCQLTHSFECPCITDKRFSLKDFYDIVEQYQKEVTEIGQDEEYDTDDFTVVIQPFLTHAKIPLNAQGYPDLKFLAPDCFHFSQIGQNYVGNGLWNNMLEPVGSKDEEFSSNRISTEAPLNCPDPSCPFIRTMSNSAECWRYFNLTTPAPPTTTIATAGQTTAEEPETTGGGAHSQPPIVTHSSSESPEERNVTTVGPIIEDTTTEGSVNDSSTPAPAQSTPAPIVVKSTPPVPVANSSFPSSNGTLLDDDDEYSLLTVDEDGNYDFVREKKLQLQGAAAPSSNNLGQSSTGAISIGATVAVLAVVALMVGGMIYSRRRRRPGRRNGYTNVNGSSSNAAADDVNMDNVDDGTIFAGQYKQFSDATERTSLLTSEDSFSASATPPTMVKVY